MNLVFDIGNTRTKAAVFSTNLLVEKAIWDNPSLSEIKGFIEKFNIENVLLSTVVAPDKPLTDYLSQNFNFYELNEKTLLPYRNKYSTPETLGKDRIAAVAGAYTIFRGQNTVVIDFGTCIKYDVLTGDGLYLGGNIAPGIKMRLQAMQHFTARLPEAEFRLPADGIGKSTESALQNGAIRGAIHEVEGFAEQFKNELGRTRFILAGGDAAFFAENIKVRGVFIEKDIVLKGLNAILRYNLKRSNEK